MYQPHSYLFDRIGRGFGLCRLGVVVVVLVVMIATCVGAYATTASVIL